MLLSINRSLISILWPFRAQRASTSWHPNCINYCIALSLVPNKVRLPGVAPGSGEGVLLENFKPKCDYQLVNKNP